MRRKLMALMIPLAALCLFAPVTEAKADTEINTYAVDGSYTVNIPAEVNVEEATNKGILSIEGTLDACYNLEIGITSQNSYQLVNSQSSARTLAYTLSDNKVVFSKEEGSTDNELKKYDLAIRVKDRPVVSGEYTDTLTFTISAKNYSQESKKHKLRFDTNCSGDNTVVISTDKKYVNENEAYGILPTPKRTGYTFDGWYTEAESGTKVDETTTMGSADTTVYAHWKANVLTINYHSGGAQKWQQYRGGQTINITGDDMVVETEQVAYDVQYEHAVYGLLDVNRLTRKGYHSGNKWKIDSPDSDKFVVDTNVVSPDNPENFKGKDVAERIAYGIPDQLAVGDVTVELYPFFAVNTYKVNYDANCTDASGTMTSTTHTYDVEAKLSKNKFTREGYTFSGWSTTATGAVVYSDEQIVSNLTGTNNGTVTLYAQWTSISETPDNNDEEQNISNTPDVQIQETPASDESDSDMNSTEQITEDSSDSTDTEKVNNEEKSQAEQVDQTENGSTMNGESDSENISEENTPAEAEQETGTESESMVTETQETTADE